ncbi:MAG: hypothetical protein AAGD00_04590 [Planctomycetota bacterium]
MTTGVDEPITMVVPTMPGQQTFLAEQEASAIEAAAMVFTDEQDFEQSFLPSLAIVVVIAPSQAFLQADAQSLFSAEAAIV